MRRAPTLVVPDQGDQRRVSGVLTRSCGPAGEEPAVGNAHPGGSILEGIEFRPGLSPGLFHLGSP